MAAPLCVGERFLQRRAKSTRWIPGFGHDVNAPIPEVCLDGLREVVVVVAKGQEVRQEALPPASRHSKPP